MSIGCGRFFEGSAEEMHTALNKTLASIPDDTTVYVRVSTLIDHSTTKTSSLDTNILKQMSSSRHPSRKASRSKNFLHLRRIIRKPKENSLLLMRR